MAGTLINELIGVPRAFYFQAADPAIANPSHLKTGIHWIDTTSSPYVWKRRNADNDGWDTLGKIRTDAEFNTDVDGRITAANLATDAELAAEVATLEAADAALDTRVDALETSGAPPIAHKDTHKSGGGDAFLSTDLLEAVVKRIQESAGPTVLTMGAVADGEFLKRSGATVVGGTPGGGGGSWTMVKKTADETKTADTTIATDAVLQFSMLANTKYMVRARIYWNSTVAADIKWRHAGPASPTLLVVKWKSQAPGSGSVTDDVNEAYSGSDNVIASLSAAHAGYIEIDAIIHNGVNAGAFAFQWAQNTSDAGNTIVYAGSWLEYQAV